MAQIIPGSLFSVVHGQVHVRRKLIQFYNIVIKFYKFTYSMETVWILPDQVISEEAN